MLLLRPCRCSALLHCMCPARLHAWIRLCCWSRARRPLPTPRTPSAAAGAWQSERLAAVLFPTADTLPAVRRIENALSGQRLVLVVNPQWQVEGQIISGAPAPVLVLCGLGVLGGGCWWSTRSGRRRANDLCWASAAQCLVRMWLLLISQ